MSPYTKYFRIGTSSGIFCLHTSRFNIISHFRACVRAADLSVTPPPVSPRIHLPVLNQHRASRNKHTLMISRRCDCVSPWVGKAFLALVSLRKTLILEACVAPTTLSHPSTFAWRRACTRQCSSRKRVQQNTLEPHGCAALVLGRNLRAVREATASIPVSIVPTSIRCCARNSAP